MSSQRRRDRREGVFSGSTPQRAIIDIGSNTVRLVVYGGSMRAPVVLLNEKVTARLGRDIGKSGELAQEAIALAHAGLARFALLLQDLDITQIETVATAATRDASNGPEFIRSIEALGLPVRVLTGEVEAEISAAGVMGAFPGAEGSVADLGGGSLEIVDIEGGGTTKAVSLPLGALRLPDYRGDDGKSGDAMRKRLRRELREAAADRPRGKALYLVGGTWRAMAVFAMHMDQHPLSDPHGYALEIERARKIARALSGETFEELKSLKRISSMRADKLPDAAVLLQAMLDELQPERIVFSSWGLREGLLQGSLAPETRAQDPLLAGIANFASQRGTPAVLATRVASWTLDAAPAREYGNERLRLAAAMLALASMQIEPNIRLPQAVDWALHKRWIAIESHERAMLAAAVSANGNALDLPESLSKLASEEALAQAVAWGLSIRLARRLGARSHRSLEASRLLTTRRELILRLAKSHAALHGGPVEKDMKLLAGQLGLEPRVEIVAEEEVRRDS